MSTGNAGSHRLHDTAPALPIPPYAMRASAVSTPHDVKTSATSRFIWGALVPVARPRVVLRTVEGQRGD